MKNKMALLVLLNLFLIIPFVMMEPASSQQMDFVPMITPPLVTPLEPGD